MNHIGESTLFPFLTQVLILFGSVRFLGFIFSRFGQVLTGLGHNSIMVFEFEMNFDVFTLCMAKKELNYDVQTVITGRCLPENSD